MGVLVCFRVSFLFTTLCSYSSPIPFPYRSSSIPYLTFCPFPPFPFFHILQTPLLVHSELAGCLYTPTPGTTADDT